MRPQLRGKHCGAFRRKTAMRVSAEKFYQGMRSLQPELRGLYLRIGIANRRVSMTFATFQMSACRRPGIHGVRASGVLAQMQAMPVLRTIRAALEHRICVPE